MILKFGSFVVLLDLLKYFKNLFKMPNNVSYVEAIKLHHPLQMFSKLVMEPNHTCLLLTLLLSPLIIWLAEMLILLRKIQFSFLASSGSSSTCT